MAQQHFGFHPEPQRRLSRRDAGLAWLVRLERIMECDVPPWVKPEGTPLTVIAKVCECNGLSIDRTCLLQTLRDRGYEVACKLDDDTTSGPLAAVRGQYVVRPPVRRGAL